MTILEDIRYGLRTMVKNPAFTAVAVTALALGIGVNATVFAITNGIFRNMPFMSDDILYLSSKDASRPNSDRGVSYLDFLDWSAQSKSFTGMALYDGSQMNVSDKTSVPTRYLVNAITPNTFRLIGQQPVLGRDFRPEDGQPGAAKIAILSDRVWSERYGRNPSILGAVIRINSDPATVVGVMRPDFRFPDDTDIWTAYIPTANTQQRDHRGASVIGKLAPGATEQSAIAEMKAISRNLEAAYPVTNKGISAWVRTFIEVNFPDDTPMLTALMGAVSFVLLIACANVANLLLARAIGRSREISIRVALGAGRWRIVRQLLIESVLLSLAGGALGFWIAKYGLRIFDANVRAGIPTWMKFSMDYRSLAYLAAISIGSGILFGLAPAFRLSRLNLNLSLKDGGRGSSAARGRFLSGFLVVGEMALAVILLAGAGVMIRSFLHVYRAQTGVNEKNVLVMRIETPETKYKTPASQIAFHDRLKARIDALPGVAVSCISATMPTGGSLNYPYEVEGRPPIDRSKDVQALMVVSPDYFRAMDVQLAR
ncbi:MAG TPA: ABC transporter permease, partial [Bryobacteraceae bacterium]|nr:ABC transporter permease [Bryobacteraceae bacterium]